MLPARHSLFVTSTSKCPPSKSLEPRRTRRNTRHPMHHTHPMRPQALATSLVGRSRSCPDFPHGACELGAYEGLPVAWLRSRLGWRLASVTVVEDFRSFDNCVGFRGAGVWNPREDVEAAFGRSAAPRKGEAPVELIRLPPAEALLALRAQSLMGSRAPYDLVYIDSRSSKHALECAVLSFPMLRVGGGVMALTNCVQTAGTTRRACGAASTRFWILTRPSSRSCLRVSTCSSSVERNRWTSVPGV